VPRSVERLGRASRRGGADRLDVRLCGRRRRYPQARTVAGVLRGRDQPDQTARTPGCHLPSTRTAEPARKQLAALSHLTLRSTERVRPQSEVRPASSPEAEATRRPQSRLQETRFHEPAVVSACPTAPVAASALGGLSTQAGATIIAASRRLSNSLVGRVRKLLASPQRLDDGVQLRDHDRYAYRRRSSG
jgi:hypothetical protein